MTKQELLQAFEMRLDGYTYKEIGDKMCYSTEYIYHALERACKGNKYMISRIKKQEYLYPNLVKEIFNVNTSIRRFAEDNNIAYNTLYNMLKYGSQPSLKTIQKLIKRTGKPMDYLFEKEVNKND